MSRPRTVSWNPTLLLAECWYQESFPFVVYGGIECLLEPVVNTYTQNTTVHQKHVSTSFMYYVQYTFDASLLNIEVYRENGCIELTD